MLRPAAAEYDEEKVYCNTGSSVVADWLRMSFCICLCRPRVFLLCDESDQQFITFNGQQPSIHPPASTLFLFSLRLKSREIRLFDEAVLVACLDLTLVASWARAASPSVPVQSTAI